MSEVSVGYLGGQSVDRLAGEVIERVVVGRSSYGVSLVWQQYRLSPLAPLMPPTTIVLPGRMRQRLMMAEIAVTKILIDMCAKGYRGANQ